MRLGSLTRGLIADETKAAKPMSNIAQVEGSGVATPLISIWNARSNGREAPLDCGRM